MTNRAEIALDLLVFKMQTRLAEGYNTLLLEDVNDVLFVAKQAVIEPRSKQEVEVI